MSDVKVPEMGESIVEGTISKWHVKEGDTVNQGDVLAELETDKVNMEISAEQSGVMESILKQEGENVAVGEAIARIGTEATGGSAPAAADSRGEEKADEQGGASQAGEARAAQE